MSLRDYLGPIAGFGICYGLYLLGKKEEKAK